MAKDKTPTDDDFETTINQYVAKQGFTAMDLVRMCGVAVMTAYKITRGDGKLELGTILQVTQGLRRAGYDISFSDVVTIHEAPIPGNKTAS